MDFNSKCSIYHLPGLENTSRVQSQRFHHGRMEKALVRRTQPHPSTAGLEELSAYLQARALLAEYPDHPADPPVGRLVFGRAQTKWVSGRRDLRIWITDESL